MEANVHTKTAEEQEKIFLAEMVNQVGAIGLFNVDTAGKFVNCSICDGDTFDRLKSEHLLKSINVSNGFKGSHFLRLLYMNEVMTNVSTLPFNFDQIEQLDTAVRKYQINHAYTEERTLVLQKHTYIDRATKNDNSRIRINMVKNIDDGSGLGGKDAIIENNSLIDFYNCVIYLAPHNIMFPSIPDILVVDKPNINLLEFIQTISSYFCEKITIPMSFVPYLK